MVALPFQFFDISAKLFLEELKPMTDVLALFIGESSELIAGFFGDEQFVSQRSRP